MVTQQKKVPAKVDMGIRGGPSEDDLFKALRYGPDTLKPKFYSSVGNLEFETVIVGIKRGVHRTGFWNISGFVLDPPGSVTDRKWREFFASYEPHDRVGFIQFLE